jgi:hypothetical protein
VGEPTHIVFGFEVGVETALTGKRHIMAVIKVNVTLPCPTVGVRISPHHADESLIAVRFGDSISLPILIIDFHYLYGITSTTG